MSSSLAIPTNNGRMFVGIAKDELMVRVGPERHDAALGEPHVRPMDFTGKPMKGYVFVEPQGCRTGRAVGKWVERAATFVETLPESSRSVGKKRPLKRPRRRAR
jgi:hypothetical protein